jgi:hypothetical protein
MLNPPALSKAYVTGKAMKCSHASRKLQTGVIGVKYHPSCRVVTASFVISCLLSLTELGESLMFNADFCLTVEAILSSYMIPVTCVAIKQSRR